VTTVTRGTPGSWLWRPLHNRITEAEWLRLAATTGDCPAQPLLLQGQPEQATQGCVQLRFEYLQPWRLHKLSVHPVPVLNNLHSTNGLSYLRSEFSVFLCVLLPLVLSLDTTKSLASSYLSLHWLFIHMITPSLLFSMLNSPSAFSLSL